MHVCGDVVCSAEWNSLLMAEVIKMVVVAAAAAAVVVVVVVVVVMHVMRASSLQ